MTGCDEDRCGRLIAPPGIVSGTTAAARAASRSRAVTASVRYSRCTATPSGRANKITARAVRARIATSTRRRNGTPLGSGFIGKSYFTPRSGGAQAHAHSIRAMGNAGNATVIVRLAVLATAGLCASACSNPASTPAPQATSANPASSQTGAAPAGTETPPPGDIPDSTAFVAFRPGSGQYEVKVPEGWARTVTPAAVAFSDKLNIISIWTTRAAAAPTAASARAVEIPAIRHHV